MEGEATPSRIAVVIPALDEAAAIGGVLDRLPWSRLAQVVVVDNGSTDGTATEAAAHGAEVVVEARRGYGSACLAGIAALRDPEIVCFLDGDGSADPAELDAVVAPILSGRADLVVGSRTLGRCAPGALAPHARWGNRIACGLIERLYGRPYTDLGPFRAISAASLAHLNMADPDYGWTAEMQCRALRLGLRVVEVPVSCHRRTGRSKVSGTVRGTLGAAYKLLTTPWRVRREPILPDPPPTLSVVIPTLNEERRLPACLAALAQQGGAIEIIVADGGSTDRTRELARRVPNVRLVEGPTGRGAQMNAGARAATGAYLWFLHADCLPPAGGASAIRRCLADERTTVGAFRFALDSHRWRYRVVEAGVRLRCRLLHLPYGDQGLFLRRTTFERLGGFRDEPLFEDLHLVRAARRIGRVAIVPLALPTSVRRCVRDGVVLTTVRNQLLLLGERFGVAEVTLRRLREPKFRRPVATREMPLATRGGDGDDLEGDFTTEAQRTQRTAHEWTPSRVGVSEKPG